MKRAYLNTAVVCFLFSTILFAADKAPLWITDSGKGCTAGNLCAVGVGSDRAEAEKNARVALVKIFDNKITSTFSSKLSADNGAVSEEISDDIKESTEAALSGLEVKQSYVDEGKFYSLASVNKRKTAQVFKTEIEQIDTKLQVEIKDAENTDMGKLEKLYLQRENLNKRHEFLVGESISCPVKYEEIYKGKQAAVKSVVAHVYLNEDEPKEIEQALADAISAQGYKVTRGKVRNSEATHLVTGKVTTVKQYLKIEGFEKYKFLVRVNAMTAKKVGSGSFQLSDTETGRDLTQAHEKAIPALIEQLQEKVKELRIK